MRDAPETSARSRFSRDAEAIVFQTPRSLLPTRARVGRIHRFLETVERGGRRMVFEPRGDTWTDDIVRRIVNDLFLIQCVGPFLRRPVGRGMRYFRLDGRHAYLYCYTDADLSALRDMLSHNWPNRVLFNRDNMAEGRKRFIRFLGNQPLFSRPD